MEGVVVFSTKSLCKSLLYLSSVYTTEGVYDSSELTRRIHYWKIPTNVYGENWKFFHGFSLYPSMTLAKSLEWPVRSTEFWEVVSYILFVCRERVKYLYWHQRRTNINSDVHIDVFSLSQNLLLVKGYLGITKLLTKFPLNILMSFFFYFNYL